MDHVLFTSATELINKMHWCSRLGSLLFWFRRCCLHGTWRTTATTHATTTDDRQRWSSNVQRRGVPSLRDRSFTSCWTASTSPPTWFSTYSLGVPPLAEDAPVSPRTAAPSDCCSYRVPVLTVFTYLLTYHCATAYLAFFLNLQRWCPRRHVSSFKTTPSTSQNRVAACLDGLDWPHHTDRQRWCGVCYVDGGDRSLADLHDLIH